MNKLKTQKAVYKHVRNHLLAQGRKAMSQGSTCHINKRGCMCSMGCLVMDKFLISRNPPYQTPAIRIPIGSTYEQDDFFSQRESMYQVGTSSELMAQIALSHGLRCTNRTADLFHDLERVHEDVHPRLWRDALDNIGYSYGFIK